jgi:hypothetical protein
MVGSIVLRLLGTMSSSTLAINCRALVQLFKGERWLRYFGSFLFRLPHAFSALAIVLPIRVFSGVPTRTSSPDNV